MLAHVQPGVHQDLQVLFCQTAFQPIGLQHVQVHKTVIPQVQGSTLSLVEFHKVPGGPFLQPVGGPLDGSMTFWRISRSQFCITCRLAEMHMKMLNSTGPGTDPWGIPCISKTCL